MTLLKFVCIYDTITADDLLWEEGKTEGISGG